MGVGKLRVAPELLATASRFVNPKTIVGSGQSSGEIVLLIKDDSIPEGAELIAVVERIDSLHTHFRVEAVL